MDSRAFSGRCVLTMALALVMCGCSTVEYRSSAAPIEVIESNYIESTNDAEIVHVETPAQNYAAIKPVDAS
jgi:hypothetical protein